MKLTTRGLGLTLFTTDVDGKARVDAPPFRLVDFPGVRTGTKVKGPFGMTIAKTKGWVLTPFAITSGPIRADIDVD